MFIDREPERMNTVLVRCANYPKQNLRSVSVATELKTSHANIALLKECLNSSGFCDL